jgi:hypothetical protein
MANMRLEINPVSESTKENSLGLKYVDGDFAPAFLEFRLPLQRAGKFSKFSNQPGLILRARDGMDP